MIEVCGGCRGYGLIDGPHGKEPCPDCNPHDHIWVEQPYYPKTNFRFCLLCGEPGWVIPA